MTSSNAARQLATRTVEFVAVSLVLIALMIICALTPIWTFADFFLKLYGKRGFVVWHADGRCSLLFNAGAFKPEEKQ